MTVLIENQASPAAETETVGDLLMRLGGISPNRIRLRPAPGTATVADVVAIDAHEDRLFELIDGVLVEKGMGYTKSILSTAIAAAIGQWVYSRKLGVVTGAAGTICLFPGQVRIPDVAFTSWARFPEGKLPNDPAPLLVPDLVVEVLSECNTDAEMRRKREEYFKAGVRLVWMVNGKARTVAVYTGAEESVVLKGDQVLDGGAVLLGFTLGLKELFGEAER